MAGVIPSCLPCVGPTLSGYRPGTLGDEGTVTLSQEVGNGREAEAFQGATPLAVAGRQPRQVRRTGIGGGAACENLQVAEANENVDTHRSNPVPPLHPQDRPLQAEQPLGGWAEVKRRKKCSSIKYLLQTTHDA